MKITAPVFSAIVMLTALAAGCGDDDPTSPEPTAFNFTFNGLPRLANGEYYEAWVSFPEEHRAGRALHGGDERASLGTFTVTQSGAVEALTGGPASFSYAGEHDLGHAADVLITVETQGDTARGPVLIAGEVAGDDAEGRTTLDIAHHDAVGADFDTANGTFILATPSDSVATNETQGIWFADPNGTTPTLTLPALGEGWIYHAHIFHGGHTHSVGTFHATNVEDSDGRGPEGGPNAGYNAPGSDFLTSALDLADGQTTAFIVIQPAGDEHEGAARSLHDSSFPMRVLETTIAAGAPPHQSIALGPRVTPWPTASVNFAR